MIYPSLNFQKNILRKVFTKLNKFSSQMIWRQIQDEKSINFNHIVRKNNNTYYNKLFKKLNMKVKIVQMTEPNSQNFNDFQ